MNNLLRRYEEENFFLIPIQANSKVPMRKKWNEFSITTNEAKQYIKHGYNLGVVSGKQSERDGYQLVILDFDTKPFVHNDTYGDSWDIEWCRSLGTWVQFTPRGFHIFLRTNASIPLLKERLQVYCADHKLGLELHRSLVDPHHEQNTFDISDEEHALYFADTVRWSSMYALIAPSKVNDKSYWWLDDCKGEIKKI